MSDPYLAVARITDGMILAAVAAIRTQEQARRAARESLS